MSTARGGQCRRCDKETKTHAAMKQHLTMCLEEWHKDINTYGCEPIREGEVAEIYWHLSVKSSGPHWLEILVPENTTLDELDRFLRDTWLDCCGHLSAFQMGKLLISNSLEEDIANHVNHIDLSELVSMESEISEVLLPGHSMEHSYDFGDITLLEITCRDILALRNQPGIILAARNTRDESEKFDSPRDGPPCFHPDGLKEPVNAASRKDWADDDTDDH